MTSKSPIKRPVGRPRKDPLDLPHDQFVAQLRGEAEAELARELDPTSDDWEARGFIGPRRRVYRRGPPELTPKMLKLVALVASGVDPGDACRQVGYRRMAYRRLWNTSELFRGALEGAKAAAKAAGANAATRQLTRASS